LLLVTSERSEEKMAVDIKKVLTSLKEKKETMLVWGLGAAAFVLGVFLLMGYIRGVSPPPSLEVVVKRKRPMKSKEEIAEEAIAKLKDSQKIPPFINYQKILTKNLFMESRMARIKGERVVGVGGFVLKGMWKERKRMVALIQDPEGKPHVVGVGQTIGTSEVKVVAIDFENQSIALMGKGWEKPQVIRLAREEIETTGGMITFKPSKEKREVEKPKEAPEKPKGITEEEAKKAIASAKRAIRKADSSIVDAAGTDADTSEALEKRDVAKKQLKESQEAYLTKDYATARSLALEAEKVAKEVVLLVEEAETEEEEEEEEEETD
jgi:hypothetical protein